MFKPNVLVLGIAVALFASLPAHAWQHRGGAGQKAGAPASQRGTMTQDRDTMRDRDMMQDRDSMRDRDRDRDRDRLDDGSTIYGSQLMTASERNAYRSKMRNLKTSREREELRMQHHQEMQQRATQRGMTLPDMPPSGGGRMNGNQQRTQQQTEQQQRTEQQQQEQDGGPR